MADGLTPHKAKKLIQASLDANGWPYEKLTARTVHFSDLTRSSAIFVRVHGWRPGPGWNVLLDIAIDNGFYVET